MDVERLDDYALENRDPLGRRAKYIRLFARQMGVSPWRYLELLEAEINSEKKNEKPT